MSPGRASLQISLAWKLPLIVGGLLALAIAASLLAAWAEVRAVNIRSAEERLTTVTEQLVAGLGAQVRGTLRRELALQASPLVAGALRGLPPDSGLRPLLLPDNGVVAALLLDSERRRVWGGGDALPRLEEFVPTLTAALVSADSAGSVGRFRALGDTLVYPVISVVRGAGTAIGHLIRWHAVPPNQAARDAAAALIGSSARVYVGSPAGAWSDQYVAVAAPPLVFDSLPRSTIYDRPGAGEQLAIGSTVIGAPWAVVTEFPLAVVMAPARAFLDRAMLAAVFLLVAGLAVAAWATRGITEPLLALTRASDAMASGDHSARVTVTGRTELGLLGSAFNTMAERVATTTAARAAAEDQWRLLFKANPNPMWVFDVETLSFLAVNDAAIARYGWTREEFLAMTILDIRAPEEAQRVVAAVAHDPDAITSAASWRHCDREGEEFDVEITSRGVPFNGRPARLVLAQDISQRALLERQLRQAQKMEAIGRLAGGIAHDFNNNLAVISAYSEMMMLDLAKSGHPTGDLEEILRACGQAHALTRQLLTFSRQRVTQPVLLNPNDVVQDVERMARRVIGEDVAIVTRLDGKMRPIRIDPGQLDQVLLNLAVNARDAMPRGGTITIATSMADVEHDEIALYGLPAAGRFVVLTVSDTGVGMTPDVRNHIFEPFFTTKEIGKGTGLGLATAYGIIQQAGGAFQVYSEVGIGSTFRIYLPAAEPAEGEVPELPQSAAAAAPRGSETILVVEDEAQVRRAAVVLLQRLGYRVLEAESPAAALALADPSDVQIDLVLSDVIMPGLSGPRLVARLRENRPGLRALLMSGYAGEALTTLDEAEDALAMIEKPFTIGVLARRIRGVLDE